MIHNRNGSNRGTGRGNSREGKYRFSAFCAQAFTGIQRFPAADCKNHIGLLYLWHSQQFIHVFIAGFPAKPDIIDDFKPGAFNGAINFRAGCVHCFMTADCYNFFAVRQTEFWNVIVNFRPNRIMGQQHTVILHENPSRKTLYVFIVPHRMAAGKQKF